MAKPRPHPLLSAVLLFLLLLTTRSQHLPSKVADRHGARRPDRVRRPDTLSVASLTREVSLVINVSTRRTPRYSSRLDRNVRRAHVSIDFGGTSIDGVNGEDGPIRVEVGVEGAGTPQRKLIVRVLDFSPVAWRRSIGRAAPEGFERIIAPVGSTTITNEQLVDPVTGEGLVARLLQRDNVYRIGQGENYNDCIVYVGRLLQSAVESVASSGQASKSLAWWERLSTDAATAVEDAMEANKITTPPVTATISSVYYLLSPKRGGVEGQDYTSKFNVTSPNGIIVVETK